MTSNQLSSLAHFLPVPTNPVARGCGRIRLSGLWRCQIPEIRHCLHRIAPSVRCAQTGGSGLRTPARGSCCAELDIRHLVDDIVFLEPEHRSITGFKHNVHRYARYDRTLFLDADMIFCRKPDDLWTALRAYRFTANGKPEFRSLFWRSQRDWACSKIFCCNDVVPHCPALD